MLPADLARDFHVQIELPLKARATSRLKGRPRRAEDAGSLHRRRRRFLDSWRVDQRRLRRPESRRPRRSAPPEADGRAAANTLLSRRRARSRGSGPGHT
jgi:hypothetical protein